MRLKCRHKWNAWGDPVLNERKHSHQFRRCDRCGEIQMQNTNQKNQTPSDKKGGLIVLCVLFTLLVLSLI